MIDFEVSSVFACQKPPYSLHNHVSDINLLIQLFVGPGIYSHNIIIVLAGHSLSVHLDWRFTITTVKRNITRVQKNSRHTKCTNIIMKKNLIITITKFQKEISQKTHTKWEQHNIYIIKEQNTMLYNNKIFLLFAKIERQLQLLQRQVQVYSNCKSS